MEIKKLQTGEFTKDVNLYRKRIQNMFIGCMNDETPAPIMNLTTSKLEEEEK